MKFFRAILFLGLAASLRAGDLDVIGVVVMRQVDAALAGSGVEVAQVEASESTNSPPQFEASPAINALPDLFTYSSEAGTATNFPNGVGGESGHANGVGGNFYGTAHGVATNVAHVHNYAADFFYTNVIAPPLPPTPAIPARIVNQSFIFDISGEITVNREYDDYAARHGTLFVSGVGNGNVPVSPPATCFNGIGVGVYGAASSAGPTSDGRCKPDLTAPGGATSFSTPYAAGAAAILAQTATRGDGGTNISAAGDARTLKALLLNGAIKPSDWTNRAITPLDARYGAGVLNVFNSWKQLSGGCHPFVEATSSGDGAPHPPGANTNNEPTLVGWDFNSITNDGVPPDYQERVHHYYFDLPANSGGAFTLTATLVWNRQQGQDAINDLNLFLYHAGNSNLASCSTSAVDNVEHLFVPVLAPGRYDLQVEKHPNDVVSADETYALAFEIFNLTLGVAPASGGVVVRWPVSPTGFGLQSATNLNPPVFWLAEGASVLISNNQNVVSLPAAAAEQFFRLRRP